MKILKLMLLLVVLGIAAVATVMYSGIVNVAADDGGCWPRLAAAGRGWLLLATASCRWLLFASLYCCKTHKLPWPRH